MKKAAILILGFLTVFFSSAQQNDWASVEKVFDKKGTVKAMFLRSAIRAQTLPLR